jgi:hypothetical protein
MLFDEAQDFSALELRLALRWAERTDTTIIAGDLDQAIYGFRGADPDAFDRIQFTERRSLDQSYRCPAAVRDLARGWMAGNGMPTAPWKARVGDDLDVGVRGTMRGHVDSLPITLRTTDQLLEHLAADLADGRTPMVLATCGYMLAPLIHQLRAASVPFHNPHRAAQGSWNPMVGANRLLAYLRHDPAIWGTDARTWTWDDLRLWTEPLAAKNVLPRGTKSLIEAKCRKDEFGRTQASQPVDLETVCRLLDTPDTRTHPAFHGDVDWWASNLRGSQTRPNAYAIDLYRRNGPGPLKQWAQTITDPDRCKRTDLPWVTIGTGHSVKGAAADCSPPDEPVLTTNRGWVPIAELDPARDHLVSFNSNHHKIHRGGPRRPDGYAFAMGSRPYDGPMLTFETDHTRTRVTPDHRLTVRWAPAALEAHSVYLMRRGRDWRIGVTKLHQRTSGNSWQSGPAMRARNEGADDVWLLGVHEDRGEALAQERLLAWAYGVPDLTYRVHAHEALTQEQQDGIWASLDTETGALRLLAEFGLRATWPMWTLTSSATTRARQNGVRNRWTVRAANFLDGYMELPTDPGEGQAPVWRAPSITRERFVGDVYSLDVERWHHYISGGAVVHNCVYIFPDLSKQGMWTGWHGGGPGRAQIVRLFYVMCSRARERVTVLAPSTPEHVPLEHLDGSSPAPASQHWATLEQRLADAAVSIPTETESEGGDAQ